MAWLYWQRRLLVGVDRWSTHLSDIDIRPVPTNGRHPPSAAGSDRSRRTVEGGVGPVEGV